jgi:hypothetical protein
VAVLDLVVLAIRRLSHKGADPFRRSPRYRAPAVTGGPATPPAPQAPSIWRATLRDPATLATAAYAIVAIGAMVAAYFAIFTQFAPYDDEGTLLVTLKAFVHGHVLYREIYSEYGPFYYEAFGALFSLTGHSVTTDASRSIVIVIWVGTSFLFGLACQRLTGRLSLGVVAMIAAFGALTQLTSEPMHPQILCVLLLGAFTLLAASEPRARIGWSGAACGTALAALTLTKINLGAFALAAIALAAVLTVEPLHRRRWLRWPVIVAFVAMPVLVTARDLSTAWVHDFALIEVFSAAAVVVAAWPARARGGQDDAVLSRWLIAALAGFAMAFVAILAAIVLTGPSLSDVYDGTIRQAIRVRDVLVTEFPFPSGAVDWGVAALAGAALSTRLHRADPDKPKAWPGVLRGIAGLMIWYSIARLSPVFVNPAPENPDTLATVLAWVAAIPPAGPPEPVFKRFLRVMLPALAVAQTLQVYPVAGSQMGIAALTFVPVGALCLADALAVLREWSAARGSMTLNRFGIATLIVTLALAVEFGLDSIVRPAANNAVTYRHQGALPFAGAEFLHLPPAEVETYSRLVNLLHRNRCTAFVGYPEIDSLYLWSEIEAPPPTAPGAWIKALESDQQQRIVNEVSASPRPCAIRSDERAELWLHGEPPPDRPLVRYIRDGFEPVATVGEFEFMLPKATIAKR